MYYSALSYGTRFSIKAGVILVVVVALGLPLENALSFLILFAALLIVVLSPKVHLSPRRWVLAFSILALNLLTATALPGLQIIEKHSIFLPPPKDEKVIQSLPPTVYSALMDLFEKHYPAENRCDSSLPGCWLNHAPTRSGISMSFSDPAAYPDASRRVGDIEIHSLQDWRAGFLNDPGYNWYFHQSDLQRKHMPYQLSFQWPEGIQGHSLCWRGLMIWERPDGNFDLQDHPEKACRTLTELEIGLRVFAGIHPSPEIELISPWQYDTKLIAVTGLRIASAVLILLVLVPISVNAHVLPGIIFVTAVLIALASYPQMFLGYYPYGGGGDGLVHEGYGRLIAEALVKGNWLEAARGNSDIFYFMPGMRYVNAFAKLIFGESHGGYVGFLLLLPLVLYGFLSLLVSKKTAFTIAIIFLVTSPLEDWGLSFLEYAHWTHEGYSETTAYALFLSALIMLTRGLTLKELSFDLYLAALLLALAVAIRPNLAPGTLILLLGSSWILLRNGRLISWLFLGLGFSPILLIPIHNIYFGEEWVLLTSSADITANVSAPPSIYIKAFSSLVALSPDSEAFSRIFGQLAEWSERLHPLSLTALTALTYLIFKPVDSPVTVRWIALAMIPQHLLLWFYVAHGRFKWLAWMISFCLLAHAVERILLPYLKTRYPNVFARLSNSRPIAFLARFYGHPIWVRLT